MLKIRLIFHLDSLPRQGGKILLDGRAWQSKKPGFWFGPTVLLHQSAKVGRRQVTVVA